MILTYFYLTSFGNRYYNYCDDCFFINYSYGECRFIYKSLNPLSQKWPKYNYPTSVGLSLSSQDLLAVDGSGS